MLQNRPGLLNHRIPDTSPFIVGGSNGRTLSDDHRKLRLRGVRSGAVFVYDAPDNRSCRPVRDTHRSTDFSLRE